MKLTITPARGYQQRCFELNSKLLSFLLAMSNQSQEWSLLNLFPIEIMKEIIGNQDLKRRLFNTPILCTVPIFKNKSEWEDVLSGNISRVERTYAIDPKEISLVVSREIKQLNQLYFNYLIEVANSSPLAIIELGIDVETIILLQSITVEQRNNVNNWHLPLFKWRYDNEHVKVVENDKTNLAFLELLLMTTPIALDKLPTTSKLNKTYPAHEAIPLVEHFVLLNMRASLITEHIPNIHRAK